MAFAALFHRVAQLQHSQSQVSRLIAKLAKTHATLSPKHTKEITASGEFGPDETSSLLGLEIHDILTREEEELELLRQDVNELEPRLNAGFASIRGENIHARGSEKIREHRKLIASCDRLTEELGLILGRFRRAQLQAKRNVEVAMQEERLAHLAELRAVGEAMRSKEVGLGDQSQSLEEARKRLFSFGRSGDRMNSSGIKEDVLLTASSDLTSSLRRTHDLLNSEVSRSRFAHETLTSSNSALDELNKRYGTLDDLLSRSRGLLSSLLRSQKSDTWYLETTLYVLLATIGWLLFRRLLYGPAWWLIWKPIQIFLNFAIWTFGGFFWVISGGRNISTAGEASSSVPHMPIAASVTPNTYSGSMNSAKPSGGKSALHEPAYGFTNSKATNSLSDIVSSFSSGIVASEPCPDQLREDTGESCIESESGNFPKEFDEADVDTSNNGEETVLRSRNDQEPPNPKKRMFEDLPVEKIESEKEEL